MNMVNTTYNSTLEMIDKLKELKGKKKIKIFIKIYTIIILKRKIKSFKLKKILFLKTLKLLVKFIMKYYCY